MSINKLKYYVAYACQVIGAQWRIENERKLSEASTDSK